MQVEAAARFAESYGGPVLFDDRKVYVGTNNEAERNPAIDRRPRERDGVRTPPPVSSCGRRRHAEADLPGRVQRLAAPGGLRGARTIEGDRLWYVSNRAEIIAADVDGFRDGENDGPYTSTRSTSSEIDEDVIWKVRHDRRSRRLPAQPGRRAARWLVGGQAVHRHRQRRRRGTHQHPFARRARASSPFDKNTGEAGLWTSDASRGRASSTASWSNPAYAEVDRRSRLRWSSPAVTAGSIRSTPNSGELLWKFDMQPQGHSIWELGGMPGRSNNDHLDRRGDPQRPRLPRRRPGSRARRRASATSG